MTTRVGEWSLTVCDGGGDIPPHLADVFVFSDEEAFYVSAKDREPFAKALWPGEGAAPERVAKPTRRHFNRAAALDRVLTALEVWREEEHPACNIEAEIIDAYDAYKELDAAPRDRVGEGG